MGDTLTVACKDPAGIILRVFDKVPFKENVLGGGVKESWQAVEAGRIVLKGWWQSYGRHKPGVNVEGSYALTHGVDKELFQRWLADNKDSRLIKEGIVFAAEKPEHVQKRADELNPSIKSGAEPLDPSLTLKDGMAFAKDQRFPRGPRGQSLIEEGQKG